MTPLPASGTIVRSMFTLFLIFLFILFVLLHFHPILLLELLESQGVRHECLVSGLFLLFDSEQGVFSNLGGGISHSICELRGNEILVSSADLVILVSRKDLINPLLSQ